MSSESTKPHLLFLVHRIPYPPDKGDKIRSFNLLVHLAEHFQVHLGTFVDDDDDWKHCPAVRRYCVNTLFVERKDRMHKLLATRALLTGDPMSFIYYRSRKMQRWVESTLAQGKVKRALAFCSPMAPYLDSLLPKGGRNVVDFVDLDSEKWLDYANSSNGPMRWLYRREARTLLKAETEITNGADEVYFVSREEADLFQQRLPAPSSKVGFFNNGVDLEYFRAEPGRSNPYAQDATVLVFTGAMDYRPNIDAVTWFAKCHFPGLRERYPSMEFWIVGGKPAASVCSLASMAGVHVTGRVPDIRPYLQYAYASVAPMRIARGIQNKVLEAMAMERPVLATPAACEGIDREGIETLMQWSDRDELDKAVEAVTEMEKSSLAATRLIVAERFGWGTNLEPVFNGLR